MNQKYLLKKIFMTTTNDHLKHRKRKKKSENYTHIMNTEYIDLH